MSEVEKQEVLIEAMAIARDESVFKWARDHAMSCTYAELGDRRKEFFSLPYEERRKYHVRPQNVHVASAEVGVRDGWNSVERDRNAVKTYRQSGDAKHAMRSVGVELDDNWTEQKRNSQGIVEVLAADLFVSDERGELTPMEIVESSARDNGLYDTLPSSVPVGPETEADALQGSERLLAVARQRLPEQHFAIFLAVKVDGQPLRTVAREFRVSYRQVWQIVDSVTNNLRLIAEEYGENGDISL